MISDIVEIIGWINITCFLVTMDIEKAFYSLEDSFLIFVLKRFCFGKNYKSCVLSNETTTQYFNLERGAR